MKQSSIREVNYRGMTAMAVTFFFVTLLGGYKLDQPRREFERDRAQTLELKDRFEREVQTARSICFDRAQGCGNAITRARDLSAKFFTDVQILEIRLARLEKNPTRRLELLHEFDDARMFVFTRGKTFLDSLGAILERNLSLAGRTH